MPFTYNMIAEVRNDIIPKLRNNITFNRLAETAVECKEYEDSYGLRWEDLTNDEVLAIQGILENNAIVAYKFVIVTSVINQLNDCVYLSRGRLAEHHLTCKFGFLPEKVMG